MPLRWRETFPEDKNPDDMVGGINRHRFARIYKAIDGEDAGRFRWFLNNLPPDSGVQTQGLAPTMEEAKAETEKHFQEWLERAGLQER